MSKATPSASDLLKGNVPPATPPKATSQTNVQAPAVAEMPPENQSAAATTIPASVPAAPAKAIAESTVTAADPVTLKPGAIAKAKAKYDASTKAVQECAAKGKKLEQKLLAEVRDKVKAHAGDLQKLQKEKRDAFLEYDSLRRAEEASTAEATSALTGGISEADKLNLSLRAQGSK